MVTFRQARRVDLAGAARRSHRARTSNAPLSPLPGSACHSSGLKDAPAAGQRSLGDIRSWTREQLRSQASVPKRGILYYHTLGNDVPANRLDRRFVRHTRPTHCSKIRRRIISIISDLGAGYVAATDHQFNPLIAHKTNLITIGSRKRSRANLCRTGDRQSVRKTAGDAGPCRTRWAHARGP